LESIRILIDAMPRILREIIEGAVERQPDMQLVERCADVDLATAVKQRAPNVVIVADSGGAAAPAHQKLLIDNPELKIFVVTDDGRSGHLLEFRRLPVAQMSPQGLITAIRAAVA
jgi:DNA-binding NarL/FixJ family response regulator